MLIDQPGLGIDGVASGLKMGVRPSVPRRPCDGESVDAIMPRVSEADQYRLGVKARKMLRGIHAPPVLTPNEPWGVRFRRKVTKQKALPLGDLVCHRTRHRGMDWSDVV